MRVSSFHRIFIALLFALTGGSVLGEPQSLAPPSVTSLFPVAGAAGTSFTVIVTGTNLTSVTAASFNGVGVTASVAGGASATTLNLFVTIAASATTGTHALTLSAPGGNSASVNFLVTAGGSWSGTASMRVSLSGHTATLLPNGKVLVVGGSGTTPSAELYDPLAGTWSTAGVPLAPRTFHTATLLPNGKVLIVGGFAGASCANPTLSSAELYNPETGTWSSAGFLRDARAGHTATLLNDGTVLVAGGLTSAGGVNGCSGALRSAEIYNPITGVWVTTGPLAITRERHAAALLKTGKVLVTGGWNNGAALSAELYDPNSHTWSITNSMSVGRYGHTETVLNDGRVLVVGGAVGGVKQAEIYDPNTGSWNTAGQTSELWLYHSALLLRTGEVVLAGNYGVNASGAASPAEIYSPVSGIWSSTGNLGDSREGRSAVVLPNGAILLTGGGSTRVETYDRNGSYSQPVLNAISLGYIYDSSPQVSIVLRGGNFFPGSVVRAGSATLQSNFVDSETLNATIPAISAGGQLSITVTNPGFGTSSPQVFTLPGPPPNPVPVLSGISPTTTSAGSGAVAVALSGTGFISTSIAQIGSTPISTTFIDSNTITAVIPDAFVGSPGSLSLTVINPPPGGGTSASVTFTVNPTIPNAVTPVITGMTPNTGVPGSTFIVAVSGANLSGATAATISGGSITASVGPGGTSTSLSLLVSISVGAQPGPRTLTITTPAGTSAPFTGFTVQQPRSPRPTTAPQPIPEVERGNVQTGYVVITPDQNTSAPLTTLTYGTVQNGIVQGQAGVVPLGVTTGATLFIDVLNSAARYLGLAIVNPASTTNAITITLNNDDGTRAGTATVNIDPYKQISKFVDELFPDAVGQAFIGSINVQSGTPFAVLGLRFASANFSAQAVGNTGTLTAVPIHTFATALGSAGTIGGANAIILPEFAMGGGWATQLALVNTSGATVTGRIDIFDTNGQPLAVRFNGSAQTTFTYTIPAAGTFVLAPRDVNGQSPL